MGVQAEERRAEAKGGGCMEHGMRWGGHESKVRERGGGGVVIPETDGHEIGGGTTTLRHRIPRRTQTCRARSLQRGRSWGGARSRPPWSERGGGGEAASGAFLHV